MSTTLLELPDGRTFPQWEGIALSWSIGAHFTFADAQRGYPKTRAVIAAMRDHRPECLEMERRELVKSSLCDRLFGQNAKQLLALIDEATTTKEA